MGKKNLLLVVVVVLVLLAGAFLYWQKIKAPPDKELKTTTTPAPVAPAAKGTLPEISPISNPLEKSPEINPVEKANPFKDLYKNPFR